MKDTKDIQKQIHGLSPKEVILFSLRRFGGKIALATSFGAEDQILTDMLCQQNQKIRLFTLDTGRLHQETYDVMEATRQKYNIDIEVFFPDTQQVEVMVKENGPNLFYRSIDFRKSCCQIRKVEPLKRALAGLEAWLCGLRKEQSITRQLLEAVSWDGQFGLYKVCPLADWTTEQVWEYIRNNNVPYHPLHDQGYPSIGCAPCTRAIRPGQNIRDGRWWWEQPEHKECGLHWNADPKK